MNLIAITWDAPDLERFATAPPGCQELDLRLSSDEWPGVEVSADLFVSLDDGATYQHGVTAAFDPEHVGVKGFALCLGQPHPGPLPVRMRVRSPVSFQINATVTAK